MSTSGFTIPGMTSCGCGGGGGSCACSSSGAQASGHELGGSASMSASASAGIPGFPSWAESRACHCGGTCDECKERPHGRQSKHQGQTKHAAASRGQTGGTTLSGFKENGESGKTGLGTPSAGRRSLPEHSLPLLRGINGHSDTHEGLPIGINDPPPSSPHSSIVNYLFPNTHRPWDPRDYVISAESLSDGGRSILKRYSERDCPPPPGTEPCIPIVSFGGVWIDPCTGCPVVADWANDDFTFVRPDPLLTWYLQTWIRPIPWTDRSQPWWPQNWPKGTVGPCPPFSPGNTPGDGWCSEGHSPQHCNLECFRSVGSNPGQQCCYDPQGRLVSNAPCAGTVDFSSPTHHEDAAGNCVPGRSTEGADHARNYLSILIPHWTVDVFEWWRNKFRYDQIYCCMRDAGIPSGTSTGGFVTREELQRAWNLCASRYDNGELFCSNWYRP